MRYPKLIPAAILLTLAAPAVQAATAKKPAGAPAEKPRAGQPAPAAQPFAAMDTDHDGRISRAEWKHDAISFAMLDANGDGFLSAGELAPSHQAAPAEESAAATAFAKLDRDHDGRLTRKEWTGKAADFDRLDHDRDGVVTKDEFLQH